MDNSTNCAKLSNKNRQELFKGKKAAKNIGESPFFPNTNGYLNWDTFLSRFSLLLFCVGVKVHVTSKG